MPARLKKSISMTTPSWEDAARHQGYLDFVSFEQAESPAPDALLTLRNGKQIDTRPEVACGFLAFLRWGERGAPTEASETPKKPLRQSDTIRSALQHLKRALQASPGTSGPDEH